MLDACWRPRIPCACSPPAPHSGPSPLASHLISLFTPPLTLPHVQPPCAAVRLCGCAAVRLQVAFGRWNGFCTHYIHWMKTADGEVRVGREGAFEGLCVYVYV